MVAVETDQGFGVDGFEAMLREHDARMRALAFRMLGDRSAMDDVLQEAYLKAWRSLGSFRGDASFSTWLYRIVTTCCLDHHRSRARRPEIDLDAAVEAEVAGLDALAGRLDLATALDRLSPDHRAAVLLVDVEGLSYDEAAVALDVAPGTVASRLNRSHHALRLLLTKEDRS